MEVVEQGDTDFVARPDSSKVVSLTLDEVNDNPDELIELRGEGRYFGATDGPTGPICSNCHQRGHKKASCKTVVCHACGLVDDHYTQQCPKSMVCTNCGEKGHYKNACTEKQRRIYCQTCTSTRHSADRCPSIWRSYITKEDAGKKLGLPNNMFCYNCAEKGHYGDECPLPRSSRVPNIDGSAFSGHNLPKQLREKYFNLHQKRKRDVDNYYDDSDVSYYNSGNSNSYNKPKPGLLDRIKAPFKSKKRKNDENDEPSRKKRRNDNNNNNYSNGRNEVRKAKSMPALPSGPAKSGFLPPRGPSGLDFPRNPRYENHNNNNNHRSGYLGPQPSRSGALSDRISQKKRRF